MLAAITAHWLLPTKGVDVDFQAKNYRKLCVLNFCHISGSNGKAKL
jgi:hypothetical protein